MSDVKRPCMSQDYVWVLKRFPRTRLSVASQPTSPTEVLRLFKASPCRQAHPPDSHGTDDNSRSPSHTSHLHSSPVGKKILAGHREGGGLATGRMGGLPHPMGLQAGAYRVRHCPLPVSHTGLLSWGPTEEQPARGSYTPHLGDPGPWTPELFSPYPTTRGRQRAA